MRFRRGAAEQLHGLVPLPCETTSLRALEPSLCLRIWPAVPYWSLLYLCCALSRARARWRSCTGLARGLASLPHGTTARRRARREATPFAAPVRGTAATVTIAAEAKRAPRLHRRLETLPFR